MLKRIFQYHLTIQEVQDKLKAHTEEGEVDLSKIKNLFIANNLRTMRMRQEEELTEEEVISIIEVEETFNQEVEVNTEVEEIINKEEEVNSEVEEITSQEGEEISNQEVEANTEVEEITKTEEEDNTDTEMHLKTPEAEKIVKFTVKTNDFSQFLIHSNHNFYYLSLNTINLSKSNKIRSIGVLGFWGDRKSVV